MRLARLIDDKLVLSTEQILLLNCADVQERRDEARSEAPETLPLRSFCLEGGEHSSNMKLSFERLLQQLLVNPVFADPVVGG